jgi:glycerophosphoryl diester phosphodiesterase
LSPFALPDRLLARAPDPARIAWLAAATYAHRGLHGGGRIENSPSAFQAAVGAGLGIECDVQASGDGQAMVFHDWELDRLTHERGPVRARRAEEIGGLTLAGSSDRIWTLPELLAAVAGRAPLLIELKSRRKVPIGRLCLAVRDALAGYLGRAAVMSFDPRVVRWFARRAPGIVRGLVVTEEGARGFRGRWRRELALWHAGPEFLAYDVRDLPSAFASRQRARGLPLLTWTVRTPELRERARLHADAAIAEGAGLA